MFKQATKESAGCTTTVTILNENGMYRVTVIHRFDSGNFVKEYDKGGLSLVAAEGLLKYYTL